MMQLRQYLNPSYAACFLWLEVLGSEIYNADSGHVSLRTVLSFSVVPRWFHRCLWLTNYS